VTQTITRPVPQVEEIQPDNKERFSKTLLVVALAVVLGILASIVAFGTRGGEPTTLAQIQAARLQDLAQYWTAVGQAQASQAEEGLFGEVALIYLGHKQSLNFEQMPQSVQGNFSTYLEHKQRLND
jgi:hypothetical protein